MDWLSYIAEKKIQAAIENGELDDLPGAGKPLQLDDDSHVPPELRASFRLLKNSGHVPEEVQLRKDIVSLEDLLDCCHDEDELKKLHGQLSAIKLRYQMLAESRGWKGSPRFREYEHKIQSKLSD